MPVKRRVVIMSIKPKYGYRVISGVKKFELRKYSVGGKIKPRDVVFLYFSYPVKSLMGMFTVGEVYEGTGEELRRLAHKLGNTGLEDEDWKYLDRRSRGMMIEVKNPRRIKRVSLEVLRRKFNFRPPRSYYVVKSSELIYRFLAKHIRRS